MPGQVHDPNDFTGIDTSDWTDEDWTNWYMIPVLTQEEADFKLALRMYKTLVSKVWSREDTFYFYQEDQAFLDKHLEAIEKYYKEVKKEPFPGHV